MRRKSWEVVGKVAVYSPSFGGKNWIFTVTSPDASLSGKEGSNSWYISSPKILVNVAHHNILGKYLRLPDIKLHRSIFNPVALSCLKKEFMDMPADKIALFTLNLNTSKADLQ